MLKKGISAFILTMNCESTIKDALESVKWADQIVIIDGFSTDKTLEICKNYDAEIHQKPFEGFDKERNHGILKSEHEWILEIDSDERLTNELQKEIKNIILKNPKEDYFFLKRRDSYIQRYLTTLKLIRLYRKGIGKYEGTTHEKMILKGKKGRVLKGHIEHKSHILSIFDDVAIMDRETEKELSKRFKNKDMGKFMLALNMLFRPLFMFLAWYVYLGYFRSGMTGLIFCLSNAYIYEFLIYVKYYERKYIYGDTTAKTDKMRYL